MMKFRRLPSSLAAIGLFACALVFSGCTSSSHTHPPRTAIEQLLLSTAVDNALKGTRIPDLEGERVYVDDSMLESYDSGYVIGSIRALLSENGARLQSDRADATLIVEARSGALGMDVADSLLGIPSIPIIIPGAGTSEFPELVIYGSNKQQAVSKIALLGYYADGTNAFSTEPLVGTAYFNQYKFLLLLQINFTDIPERRRF
ncbi:MAG: hypothetical protein JJU00_11320 [Opitutales bacterium]|nr:hypothetical protein [Opitutales bacterium]